MLTVILHTVLINVQSNTQNEWIKVVVIHPGLEVNEALPLINIALNFKVIFQTASDSTHYDMRLPDYNTTY